MGVCYQCHKKGFFSRPKGPSLTLETDEEDEYPTKSCLGCGDTITYGTRCYRCQQNYALSQSASAAWNLVEYGESGYAPCDLCDEASPKMWLHEDLVICPSCYDLLDEA